MHRNTLPRFHGFGLGLPGPSEVVHLLLHILHLTRPIEVLPEIK